MGYREVGQMEIREVIRRWQNRSRVLSNPATRSSGAGTDRPSGPGSRSPVARLGEDVMGEGV